MALAEPGSSECLGFIASKAPRPESVLLCRLPHLDLLPVHTCVSSWLLTGVILLGFSLAVVICCVYDSHALAAREPDDSCSVLLLVVQAQPY